jgi:hypothetical protein
MFKRLIVSEIIFNRNRTEGLTDAGFLIMATIIKIAITISSTSVGRL